MDNFVSGSWRGEFLEFWSISKRQSKIRQKSFYCQTNIPDDRKYSGEFVYAKTRTWSSSCLRVAYEIPEVDLLSNEFPHWPFYILHFFFDLSATAPQRAVKAHHYHTERQGNDIRPGQATELSYILGRFFSVFAICIPLASEDCHAKNNAFPCDAKSKNYKFGFRRNLRRQPPLSTFCKDRDSF